MKQENTSMENKNFRPLDLKRKMRPGESVIQSLLFIAGFLSIFITVAIVYELGKEALLLQQPDVTWLNSLDNPRQPALDFWDLALVTSTITLMRCCLASSRTGSCPVSK